MSHNIRHLVEDVVASPLGEVIASVGRAVADAQQALDDAALAKTLEIYSEDGEEGLRVLREIGYRPTFYTLPETTGEVHVSLSLNGAGEQRKPAQPAVAAQLSRQGLAVPALRPRMYATPVDAGFQNRYGYQADISAKLTFKIVPVPAPEGADELRVVPDLTGPGLTVAAAASLLESLGMELLVQDENDNEIANPAGDAVIATQDPEPRSYARLGDRIAVTIA
ncbi:MAG: hypothetical protein ACOCXJ_01525 [Planctomycetota bacterium]